MAQNRDTVAPTLAAGGVVFEPPDPESKPTIYGLDRRVLKLEHWMRVHTNSLDKINGHLSRLVWLVLAGLVAAILSMLFRAGI